MHPTVSTPSLCPQSAHAGAVAARPLKIGLLLDSRSIEAWQSEMLKQIVGSDYARIDLVVLREGPGDRHAAASPTRAWPKLDALLYRMYCGLEKRRPLGDPDAFAATTGNDLLAGVPVLNVSPPAADRSDWCGDEDVAKIMLYDLDVIIPLVPADIQGGILQAARLGVWSCRYGDDRLRDAAPPGLWEVFQNEAVTEASLHILGRRPEEGRVLFRSYTGTDCLSVRRNRNKCYWKMVPFIPRKLQELHTCGREEFLLRARDLNGDTPSRGMPRSTIPQSGEFVRLSARLAGRYISQKLEDTLAVKQWILLFDLQGRMSGTLGHYARLIPPKDRFWADPHVIYKDQTYYVFLEEYLNSTSKGHISLLTIDEQGRWSQPRPVLQQAYHLSHPFLFEWQGRYFMVPETREIGTISLFECVEFPHKWEFRRHLMEGVSAVDSTLLCHNDHWWLFTAMSTGRGPSTSDELFLFYSDDPLGNHWRPHARNPVLSDARRARPAGRLFWHEGSLCRPSQDCSKHYGYAININHVTTLSETRYTEEVARTIGPDEDKRIVGVHSFQHEHQMTIIDASLLRSRFA